MLAEFNAMKNKNKDNKKFIIEHPPYEQSKLD